MEENKKWSDRLQWENADDLLLFVFLGILYGAAILSHMKELAANLASGIAGAAFMYLRGKEKINDTTQT